MARPVSVHSRALDLQRILDLIWKLIEDAANGTLTQEDFDELEDSLKDLDEMGLDDLDISVGDDTMSLDESIEGLEDMLGG